MDYTQEIENAKQQLFSLGFTEEKYNELLTLGTEEIIEKALTDLQEKDLESLEALENNLVEEPEDIDEATRNLDLIFATAYGQQANETKQKMLLEYLNQTIQQTRTTKNLLERYQAGDPTAIATIEANKNTQEAIEVANYIEQKKNEEDIQKIADEVVEEGWQQSQIAAQQSNNNVTNSGGETENSNITPEPFPQPAPTQNY